MGYVGLPLALLFSEQRGRVTGFDIDHAKVYTLNCGGSYIFRIPGTEIQSARERGFSATSSFAEISEMDVIALCVQAREPLLAKAVCTGWTPPCCSLERSGLPT